MMLLCRQDHGIQGGLLVVANSIGRKPRRATEILRSAGLTPFREILDPACFARAWLKPLAANAVLIPEVVFWLMASAALDQPSMAAAMVSFWSALRASCPQLPIKPLTEEAFCAARSALPLRFFLRVFADLVERFTAQFGARFRWKGFRLLGIDGLEADVPRQAHLRKLFPPPSNNHGPSSRPAGRLVGLVGLWDGICYAFRWTSLAVGEQSSARQLFRRLTAMDLVLADRNFPDLESFAVILSRSASFLFHLPSNRFLTKARVPTPSGRPDEWYVDLTLPERLGQQHPALGPTLRLRILQYQRPGFRTSWLITSLLDTETFGYDELVELYHQRWRQETFHREWKYSLQLSNLRSHTVTGLLKEILVQLTVNNAVRWMMAEAVRQTATSSPDRPVDLRFLDAKRVILAALPAMTSAPAWALIPLYRQLLRTLAKQRILVRPGRSYPRCWDGRARPKGHGRVAQPAKTASPEETHDVRI
jgi:hypothetical protein